MTNKIFQLIVSAILFISNNSIGQVLKGEVNYWDEDMKMEMPLPAANVYWVNSTVAASANEDGIFKIQLPDSLPARLVVSFVGYQNDTLLIKDASYKKIILKK